MSNTDDKKLFVVAATISQMQRELLARFKGVAGADQAILPTLAAAMMHERLETLLRKHAPPEALAEYERLLAYHRTIEPTGAG
jgi:hypothetical protein